MILIYDGYTHLFIIKILLKRNIIPTHEKIFLKFDNIESSAREKIRMRDNVRLNLDNYLRSTFSAHYLFSFL